MAKFCDLVGYVGTKETSPGVWTEVVVAERRYRGDIIKNVSKWQSTDKVNDNLNVSNSISIIADAYAYENFSAIKYVYWMKQRWKVESVEVQRPRLILSIGGLYNGNAIGITSET